MLHALGITHVVSVGESFGTKGELLSDIGTGESALIPPSDNSLGHGTLWLEEREGRIKVLDVKVSHMANQPCTTHQN